MKWLEAHFPTIATLGPADYILSRHAEVVRADATLIEVFGGSSVAAARMQIVPLGNSLETATPPLLFMSNPLVDRSNAPGVYSETVRIRDTIRFHDERLTGQAVLWKPSIATLVGHLIHVVMAGQQLSYQYAPGLFVQLASRCNLIAVTTEPVQAQPGSVADNLLDVNVDFDYLALTSKELSRLYSLVTVGA